MTLRYQGGGRFIVGVPARDLTSEDLARLTDRLRARVVRSGFYVPVRPAKAVKAATEVKPNV